MRKYLSAIIKALHIIHAENLILISIITGKDTNDPYIKQFDDKFFEAISKVAKRKQ